MRCIVDDHGIRHALLGDNSTRAVLKNWEVTQCNLYIYRKDAQGIRDYKGKIIETDDPVTCLECLAEREVLP